MTHVRPFSPYLSSVHSCDYYEPLQHSIRQLKIEGATTLYIKRLCAVFFPAVLDAGKEFFRAFPENNACAASFVVWARKELEAFYETYRRQVFAGGSSKVNYECIWGGRLLQPRLSVGLLKFYRCSVEKDIKHV